MGESQALKGRTEGLSLGNKMSEGKNKQNPRLKEAGTAQDSGSILGTAEVINSLAEINQRIEYLYGYADSENTDMLSAEAYSIKALARSIGLSGTRELAKGLHLACLKRNIHEARFLVESLERMAKLEAGKLQRKLKLG